MSTGAHARTRCYVCPIDTCKQVPHLHASSLPLLSYRVRKGLGPQSDSRSVVLLMRAVGAPPSSYRSISIHPSTGRRPVPLPHMSPSCSGSPQQSTPICLLCLAGRRRHDATIISTARDRRPGAPCGNSLIYKQSHGCFNNVCSYNSDAASVGYLGTVGGRDEVRIQ